VAETQAGAVRRRVLIAEDEALIRLDLAEMLVEEGYDVVGEAGDGETAVRLVLERIEQSNTRVQTVTLLPQLRVRESCGFMLHRRRISMVEKASAGA